MNKKTLTYRLLHLLLQDSELKNVKIGITNKMNRNRNL